MRHSEEIPDFRRRRIELRQAATDAEQVLWKNLRRKNINGAKFRRQHQIGPYIVDFYCHAARLVLEVDGTQHYEDSGLRNDQTRTRYLETCGLTVLRLTNVEVLTELDGALEKILELLSPSP